MREQVESRIMHRIDTRAAAVLRYMIGQPGIGLSQAYSDAWILFILSLIFRTPSRLRWLNEEIRTFGYAFDDEGRATCAKLKSPAHPATPEECFAQGEPAELSVARMQLMLSMIGSKLIGRSLASMVWEVHTIDEDNRQPPFVERRLGQSKPSDGFLARHTWKCP